MKLNLIIDPTQQTRSLSDRIRAPPRQTQPYRRSQQNNNQRNNNNNNNQRGNNRNNQTRGPNRRAAAAKSQKPNRTRPAKKSLEDLDKEMAEYFDEKKA